MFPSAAYASRYANLLLRLEAATSRLEDIATSTELPDKDAPALNQPAVSSPDNSSAPTPRSAPKPAPEELPESIEDFDAFVNSAVAKYGKLSDGIGGLVAKQVCSLCRLQGHFDFAKLTSPQPNCRPLLS